MSARIDVRTSARDRLTAEHRRIACRQYCCLNRNSEGKHLAAVSPTYRLSARSHRLKDPVAQIEVMEESRGGMHAGYPEDDVAKGGMDYDDQLPQSMRVRDPGGDVESGKGDGKPLEPGAEHCRCWNRDEERIKRELEEVCGRSHPSRHRLGRGRYVDQPP